MQVIVHCGHSISMSDLLLKFIFLIIVLSTAFFYTVLFAFSKDKRIGRRRTSESCPTHNHHFMFPKTGIFAKTYMDLNSFFISYPSFFEVYSASMIIVYP